MNAAIGDDLVTRLESGNQILELLLALILRPDDEEIEDDADTDEGNEHPERILLLRRGGVGESNEKQ